MRYIHIIISILLLKSGILIAQIKPNISEKSLSKTEKELLNQHFKKYKTFFIDKQEILDSLNSYGKCQIMLNVDKDNEWIFNLQLNDMRTPDFTASYTTDTGVFQYKSYVPNTYKGKTNDNKITRFTIDEDEFWGIIKSIDKQIIIKQTKDYTKNNKDESLILFEKSDMILADGIFDVEPDVIIAPFENNNNDKNILKTALCTYYLQIATDADFEFFQDMGSNLANTYSYIFSALNLVEGVYESTFDLKFIVSFQNVWATSSDPYSSTTNPRELLPEFRNEWNTNRSNINRDIAHLFTGRNFVGILGISYLGQIGTSYAYALSMYRTSMYETTAHEIGHNFNALDNPSSSDCLCGGETASVMCQGLKANNLWFCQTSINEISPFLVNNSSKLTLQGNLTLSGTITGLNEYQARNKIISTHVIDNGSTIYKTPETELNQGFEVKLGAEFQIIIDDNGCAN